MLDSTTEMRTIRIRVVDESARPIQGADISPTGFRPKSFLSAHGGWRADPQASLSVTDTEGWATFSFPRFMGPMDWEVGTVTIRIDHPDYCVEGGEQEVETQEKTFSLKKGATVIVSGYIRNEKDVVPIVHPQVSAPRWIGTEQFRWNREDHGRLIHKAIPSGSRHLRLVSLREKGAHLFSDFVAFNAVVGETHEFHLELRPGARLEVELDESVLRPVKNGHVHVFVRPQIHDVEAGPLFWLTWRETNEDGVAVFESLPLGDTEVIALCDGAISRGPEGYSFAVPDVISLAEGDNRFQIPMGRTATFKVQTVDEGGNPVGNVWVSFGPNVHWNEGFGYGIAGLFGSRSCTSENLQGEMRRFFPVDWWEKAASQHPFGARTDQKGEATIRNLPAYDQSYSILHDEYTPKDPDRTSPDVTLRAKLTPGGTTESTIVLKRK